LIQTIKVNVIRGFGHKTTDSKSVSLRRVSVQVGLGVPLSEKKLKNVSVSYVTCPNIDCSEAKDI